MRKMMFLLPFAALAMASCSSSEDSLVQPQPELNTELKIFPSVGASTRGTVETTASISSFNLIASGNFKTNATGTTDYVFTSPISVTKSGTTWGMTPTLYWGDATTAGKFTAYANAYSNTGAIEAANGMLSGVTVETIVDNQKDLLVAYNEGTKTDFAAGVPLHFRHAMSQIVVKASYNVDPDIDTNDYPSRVINVKGVKFFNLNNKATLALPTASTAAGQDYTPAWSAHSGNADFGVTYDTPITLGSTASAIDLSMAANPLLLLPQTTAATTALPDNSAENTAGVTSATGAYMAVLVDINEENGTDYYPKAGYTGDGGYAWVVVPVSIEWVGGSKYIYTLNFTNGAFGAIAPGTAADAIPGGKVAGNSLPAALLTPVKFLVTVEEEWTEYNATPAF